MYNGDEQGAGRGEKGKLIPDLAGKKPKEFIEKTTNNSKQNMNYKEYQTRKAKSPHSASIMTHETRVKKAISLVSLNYAGIW